MKEAGRGLEPWLKLQRAWPCLTLEGCIVVDRRQREGLGVVRKLCVGNMKGVVEGDRVEERKEII